MVLGNKVSVGTGRGWQAPAEDLVIGAVLSVVCCPAPDIGLAISWWLLPRGGPLTTGKLSVSRVCFAGCSAAPPPTALWRPVDLARPVMSY